MICVPPHQRRSTLTSLVTCPTDASAHGPALDHHLLLNLWIALALLALAHLILLTGLLARRHCRSTLISGASNTSRSPSSPSSSPPSPSRPNASGPPARYTGADPTALQVEVTGVQFAWYFRYPGPDATFGHTQPHLVAPGEGNPLGLDPTDPHSADDIVSSQLVLPANREVDLRLNAQDVIHGFSIPEMRLKQNAVPGQTIHLHFTPTTPGTYAILCTQLCGLGHYRMNATLRVLPPDQFAAWLATQQKAAQ